MSITNILDPVFLPLLKLGIFWAVIILSFLISLLITIATKFLTNQKEMRALREEQKALTAEMKKAKDDPKKVMELQKRALEKNMKYMGHSLRATLITFLPLLILWGWMNAHLAYEPIRPGQEFVVQLEFTTQNHPEAMLTQLAGLKVLKEEKEKGEWTLSGEAGEYLLQFTVNKKTYQHPVRIAAANERSYAQPVTIIKDDVLQRIAVPLKKTIVLNLFGWKLGWLGSYILFSIVFSMGLRKVFKVY